MDVFNLETSVIAPGAYCICGDDGFLLKTAENRFRAILPDGALSFHLIDRLTSVEELASCLGVYSFDGLPNVVLIRDADAKLDERGHSSLVSLLKRGVAPDYAVFCNVNFLTAAEKKLLTVIDCSKPDKSRCVSYMAQLFPYGIERSAAFLLADYTENNLAKIDNESKKLVAYCEKRAVTLADVESLVSEDREVQIFSFANAIAGERKEEALRHLDKIRSYGTSPAAILSTLTGQFQRMLYCSLSSLSDDELAALLKIKPYAVKKAREGKKTGTKQLKKILDMLIDCEYRFKSGEIGEEAALNIAVGKLLIKE